MKKKKIQAINLINLINTRNLKILAVSNQISVAFIESVAL